MIKEGLVFLNTKNNPCLILKVDDKYCWVFARTTKGFNCNHYGKWYIEQCLRCGNYHILNNYKTWQDAVIGEEFGSREADYKKFISQVGKNLTGRNKVVFQQNTEIENLKELLKECKDLFVLEKGFIVKCIREKTLSDIIAKIDEVLK